MKKNASDTFLYAATLVIRLRETVNFIVGAVLQITDPILKGSVQISLGK